MIDALKKAEIERDFVSRSPGHPIKLPEFTEAELPDVARWRWCIVAVTDLGCVGLSNGVAWVRADGGAL